ncbi:glycosyltransferase family 4 protein [Marinimicrobium sp. C2-29]|uniref:glycosyltransferase family 4 protein n=1 Tax=Marinimicrobium sp. C2-29 TaxID=3139825 RepID=UPI0031386B58
MKVFLVVRWPVGGIRTFISYIYSAWSDPELDLHILTPDMPQVATLVGQLENINCTWYKTTTSSPSFKEFAEKASKITGLVNFDLIHAHGFTSALSIGWKLPFLKCRSIFTSHDILNHKQFSGFKGRVKRILLSITLNRYDIVQSVSFDAQSNLIEHLPSLNKKKCTVILNGIETNRFYCAEPVNLKEKLGLSQETVLIGFFGRFMSQKGFKYLVGAIEKLEAISPGLYHVACFGSGAFIREEKIDIEKKSLSHLFHFYDSVPNTAPYITGCDIVVMPSLWEACPLLPMEVLVAGVPLVASNCIGLREVCAETPAVMVEPASSESLQQGILKIVSGPKNTFKEYALVAKGRYGVEDTRSSYENLYSTLAIR